MHQICRRLPTCTLLAALILALAPFALADDNEVGESSAHLLQAEIALQAGDYLKATIEYRLAAELSESAELAQRATQLAHGFGFYKEALMAAKRWMSLAPADEKAQIYVARLELRLGKVRVARKSFEKIITADGEGADKHLLALLPILSEADPEDADQLMRSLAKPYKDSAEANYATAVMALQAADMQYAIEKASQAMRLDPDWLKPKLLYARALLIDGEEEKAIDFTARIIGDDPDPDPDARMELALMLMSVGRDDDALSQVNQILLEQTSRPDALRLMAMINFRQNFLDAAWDDFEDLLASGRYTMDALYYLARIADIREQHDRAIRLYTQVRTGQNAVVSQRRASALIAFQREDPELALQRLDEFAKNNPSYAVDMVIARARLLASLGRYEDALENYDKAVAYRPDDEGMSLGKAELLLRMERLDDAIRQYRASVRRWPESALSLNALGYTLADRTNEYREAEKHIRKALRHDPDSPAIIDSLGWVLHKRGNNEEALEHLENAYSRFADHEVAAHLVEVLVELQREDEALTLLLAAEQQDPDSELLKDVRERRFTASE